MTTQPKKCQVPKCPYRHDKPPQPEESKYIDTSKWQDSPDPIERMAYWINWLSPHNLWKSKSALQEMLSQAQQEAVSAERERIWDYIDERLQDEVSEETLTDLAKIIFEALQKEERNNDNS